MSGQPQISSCNCLIVGFALSTAIGGCALILVSCASMFLGLAGDRRVARKQFIQFPKTLYLDYYDKNSKLKDEPITRL